MKRFRIVFLTILVVSGLFFPSCDENEDKETCGERAYLRWNNLKADFRDISNDIATFRLVATAQDICIYENVDISIIITETSTSSITSVLAYVDFPSSDAPDIYFKHELDQPPYRCWRNLPYSLNMRAGCSKNPGNFTITLYIYIQASTQAEAQQKYDASVNMDSFIEITYHRPK